MFKKVLGVLWCLMFFSEGSMATASQIQTLDGQPNGSNYKQEDTKHDYLNDPKTLKETAASSLNSEKIKVEELDLREDEEKMSEYNDVYYERWNEANAKVNSLVEDISDLQMGEGLENSIAKHMKEFIEYYEKTGEEIKCIIKQNQGLIECLCLIACKIRQVYDVIPDGSSLPLSDFFTKITDFEVSKEKCRKILQESDSEIAQNFIMFGSLDEITGDLDDKE